MRVSRAVASGEGGWRVGQGLRGSHKVLPLALGAGNKGLGSPFPTQPFIGFVGGSVCVLF